MPEAADQLAENLPSDSGIYAVFDSNGELQFVGISRNIAASVLAHRKSVPELCSSVKVLYVFRFLWITRSNLLFISGGFWLLIY